MIHLRSALRLLAVIGLLAFTGLSPESSSATITELSPESPSVTIAGLTPASSSATNICSCSFCRAHPSVDCQMGPGDGFSILCADYLKLRNC